jgi:hypothetical protein
LDVRYPYLVVTTMWFIHKLWLDTHRIPQTGPQDRLTIPQAYPQICPSKTDLTICERKSRKEPEDALPVLSPYRLQGARLADD